MSSGERSSDLSPLLTTHGARLLLIERELQRRQWVQSVDLMQRLGISLATLKRDIKALREVFGAPIQADSTGMGYRLVGAWPGILRHLIAKIEAI